MDGWIKLYRKLAEWEWYQDSSMVHLYIHILIHANFEEKIWRGVNVERGQLITGLQSLNFATGISIQSLRTCLNRLIKTNEIVVKSTNRFTIITVCKYEDYQVSENDTNKQTTNEQQTTNNQSTTTKNIKNLKKEKNNIINSIESLKKSIEPFVEKYGRVMCNNFYSYWTEPTPGGVKVKFQLEKTWDTKRRLERWSQNNFKVPSMKSNSGTISKKPIGELI